MVLLVLYNLVVVLEALFGFVVAIGFRRLRRCCALQLGRRAEGLWLRGRHWVHRRQLGCVAGLAHQALAVAPRAGLGVAGVPLHRLLLALEEEVKVS